MTSKGKLNREDCDNEKACKFLKLLKRPIEDSCDKRKRIITEKYRMKVVKQSKK